MRQEGSTLAWRRSLAAAAIVALLIGFGIRLHDVFRAPYNNDEMDAANLGWAIAHGQRLYVDAWDARAPLSIFFNRLIVPSLDENGAVIVKLRLWYQFMFLLALAIFVMVVRPLTGWGGSLWFLAVFLGVSMVAARTAQARQDILVLLFVAAAFWFYARAQSRRDEGWILAAGFALALAALSKQVGLFVLAGILAYLPWSVRLGRKEPRTALREAALLACSFGFGFFLCLLVLFGRKIGAAIQIYFFEMPYVRYWESAMPRDAFILRELTISLPVELIGSGFLVWLFVRSWRPGRPHERAWMEPFFGAQIVFAVVYLAIRRRPFEQDFIYPSLAMGMAVAVLFPDALAYLRATKVPRRLAAASLAVCLSAPVILSKLYHFLHRSRGRELAAPRPEDLSREPGPACSLGGSISGACPLLRRDLFEIPSHATNAGGTARSHQPASRGYSSGPRGAFR
ncbi:MAG: glycosyltransferase family 39 protein [Deltaproteobacteria bacterium]|nr:glycosyltransferase family 39 protein [Deltaproteobacteria bacterium]